MLSDKLNPFINRYNELSDLLSSPDITSDIKRMTELSKEQSNLLPIAALKRTSLIRQVPTVMRYTNTEESPVLSAL